MQIPLTIETLLVGAVIAQGLFASALLLFQVQNKVANRFLSLLVLTFSLWLCDSFFRVAGIYDQDPQFYFLPIYFSLAFGPLTYFYTRAITEKDFSFQSRQAWHFIPVLVQFLFYLFLRFQEYTYRRWFWFEVHRPYTYDLEFALSLLSLLIYLWFSMLLVRRYQRWITDRYSEISRISLHWMILFMAVLGLLTLLWLADALLREILAYYPDQPFSAIAMGVGILILAAGGLLQADVKKQGLERSEPESPDRFQVDDEILDKIMDEMTSREHFLDDELSLVTFSRALGLPPRQVSIHLNQGLNTSFIDFVNRFRVEKVKEHLAKEYGCLNADGDENKKARAYNITSHGF